MMRFPFTSHGVLGLNARNLLYIKPCNPRKAIAFADDKMKTKAFLSTRGIPTAKVFARIDHRRQLRELDFNSLPDECVLKPNYGFGGEGILLLKGRKNGEFLEQGKTIITKRQLMEHIEDILDGKFSVNGLKDSAFFEQILVADDCFTPFRPAGLPDIRIIVFNLVPVMAMLRVPTPESQGKANVHLGGMGIGIDMALGTTTHAVRYQKSINELPHGATISGIVIPRWEELLLISSRIQHLTNIGYLAVDLTLDRDLGPVLLEVNARAGLAVQIANLAPLRSRLERVQGLHVPSPEKGVLLSRELFGQGQPSPQEQRKKESIVLGLRETIEVSGDGISISEPCSLVPDRSETLFASSFIEELRTLKAIEPVEGNRQMYRVKLTIGGKRIQTVVLSSAHCNDGLRVSIGGRDLRGFLIDPMKVMPQHTTHVRRDLRAIDRILGTLDRELSLLKYLRPLDLNEQREHLLADETMNPVFLLRECDADLKELEVQLKKLEADESPLGILLRKKRHELLLRIDLIRSRGDADRFTAASFALFGAPSPALIAFAEEYIALSPPSKSNEEETKMKSADQAKPSFEHALAIYGLHDWIVEVKRGMISDCAVGEKRVFLRQGARFTDAHLQALIAHEIETHALTAENGRHQPYEIFRRGFAHYLDTQEGLAVFNQNRVLPMGHEKRTQHAKNVLAVAYAMTHSFAETRAYLLSELGFSAEKALSKTLDLKRGLTTSADSGVFTKSLVYFRGLRAIEQFVARGGDLKALYIGKIAMEDLSLIEKIDGIREPMFLPSFLLKKARKATRATLGKKHEQKVPKIGF